MEGKALLLHFASSELNADITSISQSDDLKSELKRSGRMWIEIGGDRLFYCSPEYAISAINMMIRQIHRSFSKDV